MDSQDEDENICNTSLGREVMQTVTTNLSRPSILKVNTPPDPHLCSYLINNSHIWSNLEILG